MADSNVYAASTTRDGRFWLEDSLEVMLDPYYDRGAAMGADDRKFFVTALNTQRDEHGTQGVGWNASWTSSAAVSGTIARAGDVDHGYQIELALPWSVLGVDAPMAGRLMGFEVKLNDPVLSSAGLVETAATWNNANGGGVNDPNGWGTLKLGGTSQLTLTAAGKPVELGPEEDAFDGSDLPVELEGEHDAPAGPLELSASCASLVPRNDAALLALGVAAWLALARRRRSGEAQASGKPRMTS